METLYSKAELVAFGNYLLSRERRELYASHPDLGDINLEERLSAVSDADISNFFQ